MPFKQWRDMEWQPLVIEWPKLAVVHVLNGKALMPRCVRLTTMVLCATDEDFEPQQHHLVALPVDAEQFASSGIPLIENPLIERLFAFQGAVIAFCFTIPRYFEILEMSRKHDIQEADIERMLPRYCKELTLVWQQAQTELELLLNALAACEFPQVPTWNDGLCGVCEKILFTVNQDKSLSLTHEDFEAWSTVFDSELQQMHALVADMLSTLLSHAPPGPSLTYPLSIEKRNV